MTVGTKYFGARRPRLEDPALLTGRGRFVDDIHVPDMLHAAFVRSPHAHARIRGIDATAARAIPGVHAIYTWRDMPPTMQDNRMPLPLVSPLIRHPRTQYCLAREEVCYVGEVIAVVIAESPYLAEDAVQSVQVDYEPLGVVADCRQALNADAARAHGDLPDNLAAFIPLMYGDLGHAFDGAAHVVKVSLWQNRGGGHAMECRGALARYDRLDDSLTLWRSGLTPHGTKLMLTAMLGHDPNRLRVVIPDVGGGFGPKGPVYAEELVVAACAKLLGRPVKWIEDRREHFLATTQERDQYWDLEMALDADGRIRGIRGQLLHDNGAYLPASLIFPLITSTTTPGPYVVPSFLLEVRVVFTNKVPTAPVRGAGRPQAVFAMERLMDKAAKMLGLDRAEIRRRNLIRPEQMPYAVGLLGRDGTPLTYDSGDYPACQAKAIALGDYEHFEQRRAAALAAGHHIGIGIGNYVEASGFGPFEGGTVRVMPNGRVTVITGTSHQGQGHRTAFLQVCADALDVSPDDIDFLQGDTALMPLGIGTFASRVAVTAGSSIHLAAQRVRTKIVKLAAHALGAAEEDIEVANGRAFVRGDEQRGKSFAELAIAAQGQFGICFPEGVTAGLEDTQYFTPVRAAYCNGTHVVEVDVEVATGHVKILRYSVTHDSGRIINPLIVDGQVRGGVAHGIGNALLERMKYDENAQPLTTTFSDYLLPTATDVPNIDLAHQETPSPLNPLGVKGVGESGTVPVMAAVISAVEDALRRYDIEITDSCVTPEGIVELLRAAGAYSASQSATGGGTNGHSCRRHFGHGSSRSHRLEPP